VRETLTEGFRDYLAKRPLPLRVSVIVSTPGQVFNVGRPGSAKRPTKVGTLPGAPPDDPLPGGPGRGYL
jgi:hypothetical protein